MMTITILSGWVIYINVCQIYAYTKMYMVKQSWYSWINMDIYRARVVEYLHILFTLPSLSTMYVPCDTIGCKWSVYYSFYALTANRQMKVFLI